MPSPIFAPVCTEDTDELLAIYTPYVLETAVTFEYEPPSRDEFAARIRAYSSFYPFLKCVDNGEIVGYGYAHRHMERKAYQWNAEMSLYFRRGKTGKGMGLALYSILIQFARLQYLHNVYGCVALPNEPSERLHGRLGFEQIAFFKQAGYKFGQWHDMAWYGLRIAEGEPREPRPFSAIPAGEIERVLARQP